jgi:Na+/H+ antiporter NhaD/arsenite permease-like protein
LEQTTDISQIHVYIAIVVFLATYALIISEKVNRTVIALLGAVLMIGLGVVDTEVVFKHHIEWNTIALLVGMMILVGITNKTGIFQYVAIRSAQLAKGHPIRILLILSSLTAFGSAFLDNVTTVLLIVPVTFSITRILGVNPVPYLISEVLASNIGGTATLIGDPPNIMIGQSNKHLDFNAFIIHLSPVVALIMVVTLLLLYVIYKKELVVNEEKQKEVMKLEASAYIKDRPLLNKSVSVLLLTILGFILHSVIHLEASVIAIGGATILMLIGVKEHDLEEVFHSVEWGTIFFFAGLFTLVGGLVDTGVIRSLAEQALEITGGGIESIPVLSMLILWISGFASATVDNIPFVATMIPLIQNIGAGLNVDPTSHHLDVLWWSLALGADIGGNGTLIGASANVIVAGMAAKEGYGFTYWQFFKIGAPLTLIALIISTIYIYLRYLLPII